VIAFLAAIMMTLIIILVVSIIVIKTRRVSAVTAGNDVEYRQVVRMDRQTSQNMRSEYRLYIHDDIHNYAMHDQCAFSTKSSDKSNEYGYNQQYTYTQIEPPLITSNNCS
jgi:hypothetical protein